MNTGLFVSTVALSGTTPNCQAYQIGQNNGSAYVQVECTVGPLARYDLLHLLYNNKIVASPESYTITRFSNTTDAGQYSSHGLITILAINNNTLVPVCALEKKMHQQEQKQTCINLNLTGKLHKQLAIKSMADRIIIYKCHRPLYSIYDTVLDIVARAYKRRGLHVAAINSNRGQMNVEFT